jgi:two-component system chemotaxis response regulator CheY
MPRKILTVDDSTSIRQMVGFTLKQAGYEVTEAQDGKEGLARAQAGIADLIITDLNMPNMNGIEMITAIRQLPQYKFTPILMLTTESDESKKQAGRTAGATGWIVKPFNPDQLLKVIQKVLP